MPSSSSVGAGRRQRFEELYEQWYLPVLGYLARRTVPPSEAADVLAEVFLVAWRRIDDVPTDTAGGPWLFGVARRCLANHRRGSLRRARLGLRLSEALDVVVPPVEEITSGADVRAALRSLPETDQELLTLIAWEGLTPTAAAESLGLASGTVRVRLHRARRRLRAALAAQSEPASIDAAPLRPLTATALQEDAR